MSSSRIVLQQKIEESRSVTEGHVDFLLKHAVPKAVTLEEIARETYSRN